MWRRLPWPRRGCWHFDAPATHNPFRSRAVTEPPPANPGPAQRGISPLVVSAFVALIALICGLVLNGLLQLQALGDQLDIVVERHNRKINIITQTQVAAHIRTDNLFRMVVTDDPFERDALFQGFNHAGYLVGQG